MAGGAGLHAYQLARHVDRDRYDVTIVFGPGYPLDEAIERERISHSKLAWTRGLDPVATLRGTLQLSRVLKEGSFDIVHTHCSLAGAIGRVLARWHKVPSVLFTVQAFASRDHQPAWRKRLFLMIERWLDRYTDRYLVSTRFMRQQLSDKRISGPERVSIIPFGIDVGAEPSAAERNAARLALGLGAGDLAIAMAGRLEQQKGVTYLLRAFAHTLGKLPHARLVIFGDGPLMPALRNEARRLGVDRAVTFAGWRTDVESLLPAFDVFCLPSLWESFGYVLLEAMAAKLPLVATRVESIPEVTGDGECAVLVPPADETALAAALTELLSNPDRRAALAAAGRHRVERDYTLDLMIGRFEAFYCGLAKMKP